MTQKAVLFIDIDDYKVPSYYYRTPHYLAAKEMGITFIIASPNKTNKKQLLENCDDFYPLNNVTEEEISNLIADLGKKYHIQGLFCYAGHASDVAEIGVVVSHVCQKLGLPYSPADAIKSCNNKFLMRTLLKNNNVRSVDFALCHDEKELLEKAQKIGYPLILKPPFGGRSCFIKKCQNADELLNHYRLFKGSHHSSHVMTTFYPSTHDATLDGKVVGKYIPEKTILLEGYIKGREGTIECVIHNGDIYPLIINEKLILTEKSNTILENLLICPTYSYSEQEVEEIKKYAVQCIKAIGIKNDIIHLEFRLTEDGPVIIEINPRVGGLYVDEAFKDIAGIDPYKLYLSMVTGENDTVSNQLKQAEENLKSISQYYSMMVIYPEKSGYFHGFKNKEFAQNHEAILKHAFYPSGNYVNADVEENYLFKCWAKVKNSQDASKIYQDLIENLSPTLTLEKS